MWRRRERGDWYCATNLLGRAPTGVHDQWSKLMDKTRNSTLIENDLGKQIFERLEI
jgi:hypothetical protein